MTLHGGVSSEHLQQLVARIERLEEEKKTINTDIKEVYGEAKSMGFDPVILRQVIRLRRVDIAKRQEHEAILDLYLSALGMQEK